MWLRRYRTRKKPVEEIKCKRVLITTEIEEGE